jgi:hypothetical protein
VNDGSAWSEGIEQTLLSLSNMKFWAGVTDYEWYTFPAKHSVDKVNMRKPSLEI